MIRIRSIAPHTHESVQEREMERKRRSANHGTSLETVCLPEGPLVLESNYQAAQAAWPLVQEVVKAEAEGVDAVIIDCFADPAIEACREASSLPVIGPGQAGILVSLFVGERVGIVSPNEYGLPISRRLMVKYGVEDRISYWNTVLKGTENIHGNRDRTRTKLLAACNEAVRSRACDVLLLGCTGLEPYWEDIKEEANLPIPVVNPFPCALKLAELFVSLGLSNSKLCYPGLHDSK